MRRQRETSGSEANSEAERVGEERGGGRGDDWWVGEGGGEVEEEDRVRVRAEAWARVEGSVVAARRARSSSSSSWEGGKGREDEEGGVGCRVRGSLCFRLFVSVVVVDAGVDSLVGSGGGGIRSASV